MTSRAWCGGLMAVLVLATAGCDTGSDEAGGTTTTAEPTTTTAAPTTTEAPTTTLSPEEEVLAAYRAANDALASAYDPPNPNHPDLLAHWGGEALSRVQNVLIQLQGEGVSWIGTTELYPTLVSLAGDTAVIENCYVNHTQPVDTVSREPRGEPGDTVGHIESHLERNRRYVEDRPGTGVE